MTNLDAREPLRFLGENFSQIEMAIIVLVFKDQDAVAEMEVKFFAALGVGVILCNPQPPARVPSHADGVLHVRLGGKDGGLETRWKLDFGERFPRRQKRRVGVGLAVINSGKLRGLTGSNAQNRGLQA